jgi:ABC-2 type transport system ATP-binding protein
MRMQLDGTDKSIVAIKNLVVAFGKFRAVNDVSFTVERGQIFGFLGANGAGKTTTIRVLCGLLVPTSGEVIIDNEKFVGGKEFVIKQKVGYMSQKFTLYNDLTIEENLNFTSSMRRVPKDVAEKRRSALFEFIGFSGKRNTLVSELPSGTKQEIALVASMLHDPKIIFLDEPTAGVASAARARFWNLIKQLSDAGKTIFVTTHYMDEAENCDTVALMRSGDLIALDSPSDLKKKTYKEQIYRIKLNNSEDSDLLYQVAGEYFSSLEPYGRHFHAIIKKNMNEHEVLDKLSSFCETKKIEPSLEDVFVRLVEGDSR